MNTRTVGSTVDAKVRVTQARSAVDPNGKTYWLATDAELPGPYGMGATAEEAIAEFERAREMWLELLAKQTPEPTSGPREGEP